MFFILACLFTHVSTYLYIYVIYAFYVSIYYACAFLCLVYRMLTYLNTCMPNYPCYMISTVCTYWYLLIYITHVSSLLIYLSSLYTVVISSLPRANDKSSLNVHDAFFADAFCPPPLPLRLRATAVRVGSSEKFRKLPSSQAQTPVAWAEEVSDAPPLCLKRAQGRRQQQQQYQ